MLTLRTSHKLYRASIVFQKHRGVDRKTSGLLGIARRYDVPVNDERLRTLSEMVLIILTWCFMPRMLIIFGPQESICSIVSSEQF